ncbi:MAG: hypothetical protein Kow0089_23160 [Desulfobulbaceae bacterium]
MTRRQAQGEWHTINAPSSCPSPRGGEGTVFQPQAVFRGWINVFSTELKKNPIAIWPSTGEDGEKDYTLFDESRVQTRDEEFG